MLALSIIVTLAALVLALILAVQLWQRMPSLQPLQDRARIRAEEIGRVAAARTQLAARQASTESVIESGTVVVRAIHKGIASIPFAILESIPSTREKTRQVRLIHDAIADGVYGSISAGNKLLGQAARNAINPPPAEAPNAAQPQNDPAASPVPLPDDQAK